MCLYCRVGKHGCTPEECADLGQYVAEECPHLELCGLMTIGRQCQMITPNPDFVVGAKTSTIIHVPLPGVVSSHSVYITIIEIADVSRGVAPATEVLLPRAEYGYDS